MRGAYSQTKIKFSLCVLIWAATLWCVCLSFGVLRLRAESPAFKSFSTSDGLAHDRVERIVRDSRGFLWFCTAEGLSRFDGYAFKNYTQADGLPHRAIHDFLETSRGEIWLATGNGIVLFDPLGKSSRDSRDAPGAQMFRSFRFTNNWSVYDLMEASDGTIWAAASDGVYQLVRQDDWQLRRFDIPEAKAIKNEEFTGLLEDDKHGIWAAADAGLYRILPDRSGIQTIYKLLRAGSLLSDRNGFVWIGSVGGQGNEIGLHQFSVSEDFPKLIRTFRQNDGLCGETWLNDLLETSDGRILVGQGNSLCEYLPQAAAGEPKFRVLSKEGVVAIAQDTSGNIWFSTNSSGVQRLARDGFINFDKSDNLLDERISSVFSSNDDATYVLAETKKIYRFNGRNFSAVIPRGILPPNWGRGQISFRDHTGAWWIASYQGLQRYPAVERFEDLEKTASVRTYTTRDGLASNEIFRLFEDSRGDIWISSIGVIINTLTRWERATDKIHVYTTADGLPASNAPTAFAEDRAGNIWIGYYEGDLFRYRNGKFESFTAESDLPPSYIGNIFVDTKGRLWAATSENGVIRIDDPTTEQKPSLVNLTIRDGLSSDQANCVTEDNYGRIYIAAGRGLNRLDLQTGNIKVFTKADGLPENIVTRCSRDAQGSLWLGTWKGVARYFPQESERGDSPPIFISDLRVNGESVANFSQLGETRIENLDFTSDQRQIQIDFFALSFSTGETLRYQYKLNDADWSDLSEQRTVRLNLAPGNYNFAVRAVNSEGVISKTPAQASFSIARPIWQRWWVLLLAAIIFGLLIYTFYRYRLRRMLELERVRTRIATDLHDDIGSSLSQIAILSEVVRQKVGENGVSEPLNIIADTSREMVDAMSDIVWAINPERDSLADLVNRMRRFASDVLDAKDIDYRFYLPDKQTDIPLGADVRREVYLMFKESVNNLAKHSAAAKAELTIKVEDDFLVVIVKDNGKGFQTLPPDESPVFAVMGGNGLPNLSKRTKSLGGEFQVNSKIGAGTEISFKIPVHAAIRIR